MVGGGAMLLWEAWHPSSSCGPGTRCVCHLLQAPAARGGEKTLPGRLSLALTLTDVVRHLFLPFSTPDTFDVGEPSLR